jgi:tRNA pseudouridine38-40 synthase
MRFRLLIEYDGTAYCGWQIQDGQVTVQGEIENALKKVLGIATKITGAGRTDTGVHAIGQVAHFDVISPIDPLKLQRSLNGILDRDIRIKEIEQVDKDFHSRYDAKLRRYRYNIAVTPMAILRHCVWQVYYKLDLEKINAASEIILGQHDFRSFCRANTDVNNYMCHVYTAQWSNEGDLTTFIIQADRFLHGMVRALVGTFVDIGRNKIEISDVRKILKAQDRNEASPSAPARGLILEKIFY